MIIAPNDAYEILVIILSVTLAVFLILAIVATSLVIHFLKKVNKIADKAETIVNEVESFSASLKSVAGPMAAIRAIMGAVQGFRK